jgi:hypothetical protein
VAEGMASTDPADDEPICIDDYPEHDFKLFDEGDGDRVYHCRRCGAEIIESEGEDG